MTVEMDTVGPMKLSLPKAVFLFLKQFGSLDGLYWMEERVAEYGDVSAGAVTAHQVLPNVSERRIGLLLAATLTTTTCVSHILQLECL